MKRRYLIVSEGETDYEVLRGIISEHAKNVGWTAKVEAFFPGIGKHKKDGGWSNLKSWCTEHSRDLSGTRNLSAAAAALGAPQTGTPANPIRKDKLAAALKLQAPYSYTTFIIQLDTDVAEDYMKDTIFSQLLLPLSTNDRKRIGEAALDSWLGGHTQKKNGQGIIYCVSTHAIETFLLANHDQAQVQVALNGNLSSTDYDNVPSPDQALINLGYTPEIKNGKQVLKKTTSKYRTYANKFGNNLQAARQRSSGLNTLLVSL
ncbi:hypothetical protein [Hydrogenophaga luteola]|uniref:DUF3800 domain-containing protein n=1 Tax=Hydrogenophaga luteola TaxID=1591122 RepID=A0ABV7W9L0_9BURK